MESSENSRQEIVRESLRYERTGYFALRAPAGAWEKFWLPVPPPGFHDLFALLKQRLLRIEGDFHPLMANLFYFKEVIAALRLGGA